MRIAGDVHSSMDGDQLGGAGLEVPCSQACFGRKRTLPQRGPFSSAGLPVSSVALGAGDALMLERALRKARSS
jgi:hypothetical protein